MHARAQAFQQHDLTAALAGTNTSALVLDVSSGKVIAQHGPPDTLSFPGSTLKPFVLTTALHAGVVDAHTTLACRGILTIQGHNLACTHPRDITAPDARQALAESCNNYFAQLAARMPTPVLLRGLQAYGFHPTGTALSPDDRALLALGVAGVRVSPRQLAAAYRQLAQQMEAPADTAARVVQDGMLQSVQTGMAHAAHVEGLTLAGKTGSMHDASDPRGHGWFAGIVFAHNVPQQVLVLYLPGGNGNDAATLARRFLASTTRSAP